MTRALTLFALLLCSQAHAAGMLWANQQQTSEMAVWFVPGANGTLSGATLQTVTSGASCSSVTAVPGDHCHFVNWTRGGAAYSTANPLTVTNVTESMSLTANFTLDTYTVTFVAGANGTLSGTTTQTVAYGASSSAMTAVPAEHYHFANWTGSATSTANPLTVANVTANMTITANFAIDTYTVTFTATTGGTLTGTTTQVVNHGASCSSVTATPNTGYHFVTWDGSVTSTSNPLTVSNVTANMYITAIFAPDTRTVTFAAGNNGHISDHDSPYVVSVDYGGSASAWAIADSGYRFVNWTGYATETNAAFTATNVTSNRTYTANFVKTWTVTVNAGSGGTTSVSSVVVDGAGSVTITAFSNTGYHFVNWTGSVTSTSNPLTISNVASDMSVTANFAINTYLITFYVSPNPNYGTLSGITSQTVNYGGSCTTVTATANSGYAFGYWYKSGTLITNGNTINVTNVTADASYEARFVSQ